MSISKMLPRTICRTCRAQLHISTSQVRRQSTSSYDHLLTELPSRPKIVLYDDLAPLYTHRLNISLASFVPSSWVPQKIELPEPSPSNLLPPAHHLVYFNAVYPEKMLLADGTDPNQSPGAPFVRRMWAGGYVRWPKDKAIAVDGSRYACVEGIRDVTVKGKPGEEKVFVGIERRFGPKERGESEDGIRERLWEEKEDDFGDSRLIERRNIVFMQERTPEELARVKAQGQAPSPGKMLKRMRIRILHCFDTNDMYSSESPNIHPHSRPNTSTPLPILGTHFQRACNPSRSAILQRRRRTPQPPIPWTPIFHTACHASSKQQAQR